MTDGNLPRLQIRESVALDEAPESFCVPNDTPAYRCSPFMGREQDIQRLHDLIKDCDGEPVALLGASGIGQTQLAL